MSSALSITDATRSALFLLVKKEEHRVGSRDVAFENVARLVGTSSSWIKKFIGRSGEVKEPRMTLFLNIRFAYEALCNRVEQEHRNEIAKIRRLQGEISAATDGFVEMVDGSGQTPPSRKMAL